ncbi:MAG: NAD+ synthase [Bacteroidota bacterium]|nr:NAD+ synthase [Bacteroidota bacterium]
MKIALAQQNFKVGDFGNNTKKIISLIEEAKKQNVKLIVFPEMAISAYPSKDFFNSDSFIDSCYNSINKIASHCDSIAVIIGSPSKNTAKGGRQLFNSAFFIKDAKVEKIINKTILSDFNFFAENQYFEPNKDFSLIEFNGYKIGITIGEDIQEIKSPNNFKTPMEELQKLDPDFIINIATTPFSFSQQTKQLKLLQENAIKNKLPIYYINQVGAQTEILFQGGSTLVNSTGKIVEQLSFFKEELKIIDHKNAITRNNLPQFIPIPKIEKVHDALVMGVKDYFQKLGFTKAILGLSGGIDSAVTLAILEKALDAKNVKALLLPSMFSSSHSVDDAEKLAQNLSVDYEILNIANIYKSINKTLESSFKGKEFDLTEENIQARIRAILLMSFSNKFGNILINASNKSEIAVGYGTLYGDTCGGLSVLGDVYKTEVFELARFINSEKEIIPENTITKPPSAELRPNQQDSDSLPDYDILDEILFNYIEESKTIDEIFEMGFDKKVVKKVISLVNINEHKRHQLAPALRISDKAFGIDRDMPIVAHYNF